MERQFIINLVDGTGVEKDVIKSGHVGPIFDFASDHHVTDAALEIVPYSQRSLRLSFYSIQINLRSISLFNWCWWWEIVGTWKTTDVKWSAHFGVGLATTVRFATVCSRVESVLMVQIIDFECQRVLNVIGLHWMPTIVAQLERQKGNSDPLRRSDCRPCQRQKQADVDGAINWTINWSK